MCKILVLQPDVMPLKDNLANAVYNNPHGYGLILKDKKKNKIVNVIRDCPSENDPEVIYKLLDDNKKYERFLHLRWKTEGEISLANTQPFKVFERDGREIWFMHNGTLHTWSRPAAGLNLTWDIEAGRYRPANEITDDSLKEASDSRRYAELELVPFLSRLMVNADLHDPVIQEILKRSWNNNASRGLLIANDQAPLFFSANSWKTIKGEGEKAFFASNDDYFDKVIRGPEKERREEEDRKKREADNKTSLPVVVRANESLKVTCPSFRKIYGLGPKARDLFTDWSLWSPDGFVALANLSENELVEIVKGIDSEKDMAYLLLTLTGLLKSTGDDNIKLTEKNERASKYIEELTKKIKELEQDAIRQSGQSPRTDGKPGFKAEIKSTKERQDAHVG
jgi:hypothetical protein